MITKTLIVKESGIRLDKYLAEKVEDLSRSQLQKYIKNGSILVNGEPKPTKYQLIEHDKIQINILEELFDNSYVEPQDIPLDILYEDDSLIVINKQAGLTVHPGVGNHDGTLANALMYHFEKLSDLNGVTRPGIVHRLDQDTSGVIVVAKNNFSHMKLSEQFSQRKVKKIYFGITWGKWKNDVGIIDKAIARKRNDPTSYFVNPSGKEAQTKYQVLKETNYFTIINYFPRTGRTHQIRVHSAFCGNPIIGDEKYGGSVAKIKGYIPEVNKKMEQLFKNINRHILHAQKITFTHPVTGNEISIKAGLPDEINTILKNIDLLDV